MRRIALIPAFAVLLTIGAGNAQAQVDNRALYDRIDRLERDIQVMQQNVSRGGGSTIIRSPSAGGGASVAPVEQAPMPPGLATRLDDRVDQIEEQVRQLTGKLEEVSFRSQQVLKQVDLLQKDLDLRFKDMQAGQGGAAAAPAAQQPALAMPAANGAPTLIPPKSMTAGANGADQPGPPSGPQVLGTMPADKKPAPVAAATPAAPAPKDAQGMYDEAFAASQKGDYPAAERGFQAFLDKNPSHPLAGNASFWLGDIAYVKKDYGSAAAAFLEAYKKYPKHTKAPDMIYKAGSSFGQMGKKKEACTAFGILAKEHPDMPDRVKRAVAAEKQKYECK